MAHRFLRRSIDSRVKLQLDDLVQEVTIAAWRWSAKAQDPARIWAAVRTIASRACGRVTAAARRAPVVVHDADLVAAAVADVPQALPSLTIAGKRVSMGWARARLAAVLSDLSTFDRQLLLGFHEGFGCAELAVRSGRSEDCVKTRIHRARRRVRIAFETIVRAAGELEQTCE